MISLFRHADPAVRDMTYVIGIAVSSRRKNPDGTFCPETVFRMSGNFPEKNLTVKTDDGFGGIR